MECPHKRAINLGFIEDCKRAGDAELVSPALHLGPQETVFVSWGGSVGKRDTKSSLRSPVGTAQGHYLCRNY
jgi:hypothetical protein